MSRDVSAALERLASERLPKRVVEQLYQLIGSGQLRPGDRLPPERVLADRLGVGRNSVREALRELDTLGLIESRQGDGTYIREFDLRGLMSPFRSVIALSTTSVETIMEFRRTLEPEVAALAAKRLSPQGEDNLRIMLEGFEAAVRSGDAPETADTSFHLAVAQATGNPAIAAVNVALLELLTDFRRRLSTESYRPTSAPSVDHRGIFDAIRSRDPGRARAAMAEHLGHVEESLLR